MPSYVNLAKRAFIKSLYRDLIKRDCQEVSLRDLYRDLAKRSLTETHANRALIEILYGDLAWRPLVKILFSDLVKREEVLPGDLV